MSRTGEPWPKNLDRLERVRELLSVGLTPAQVADELGLKQLSLERWLDRRGHHTLARRFSTGAGLERWHAHRDARRAA